MSLTVLIVEDEDHARINIGEYLNQKGYNTLDAPDLNTAKKYLSKGTADIMLLDAQLPDGFGPTFLEETNHDLNRPPTILITAHGDIDMAVTAMKNGAHDFLQKPIKLEELEKSINRAGEIVKMRRELMHLRDTQKREYDFILGDSPELRNVFEQGQRAADASVSVLITGDTGVGKEVLAREIHNMGPRRDKPFIAQNCAAIQNTIFESELFGHEPGAYTSAEERKLGLMEVADGGILFLDEISSMPLDIQAKVLRALDEKAFRRMGGNDLISVDVHVLAASNRDLKQMMANGEFRDDLYYRLKVVDLHIPTLKERSQDISGLVGHFISKNNPKMGLNIEGVTSKALGKLVKYNWPGNIRELKNVIERAMIFCDDALIDVPHLPAEIAQLK